MPTTMSPSIRRWLEGPMLRNEGGYKPKEPPDTETLFGVTIANWKREIPEWVRQNPEALAQIPENIRTRLVAIERAASEDDHATLHARTSSLLQYVGRQLKPIYKEAQPDSGTPYHSYHFPPKGSSAQALSEIRSMQEVAFSIYNEEYVVKPGFHRWPEFMQEHGMDFGIHAGPPRANWAAVKALYEAGVISEQEYKTFPQITADQANDKHIFARKSSKDGPGGHDYGTAETKDRIVGYFQRIDPNDKELQQMVWDRFKVWRSTYNNQLIEDVPALAKYENGFRERLKQLQRPVADDERIVYSLPIQYRKAGLFFWQDDRIALQVHAIGPDGTRSAHTIQYFVDAESGEFTSTVDALPPAVEILKPGEKNRFGHENQTGKVALSWLTDEPNPRAVMMGLDPVWHQWVRDAAIEPGMLYNSVPTDAFAQTPNGQLDREKSDLLQLTAKMQAQGEFLPGRVIVENTYDPEPLPPGVLASVRIVDSDANPVGYGKVGVSR